MLGYVFTVHNGNCLVNRKYLMGPLVKDSRNCHTRDVYVSMHFQMVFFCDKGIFARSQGCKRKLSLKFSCPCKVIITLNKKCKCTT